MNIMDSSKHFSEPVTKAVDLAIRKKWLLSIECWQCTRHCTKHLILIISLNLGNDPKEQIHLNNFTGSEVVELGFKHMLIALEPINLTYTIQPLLSLIISLFLIGPLCFSSIDHLFAFCFQKKPLNSCSWTLSFKILPF